MKKNKTIIGFEFTQVPLDEAVNAVIAGDGDYADIKTKLLETLPNLPPDKAFAFGLPGGKEVDEDYRRGICFACNKTLNKAQIPWRVTYSGTRKLFICVPKTQKAKGPAKVSKPGYDRDIEAKIIQLRDSGMSVREIVAAGHDKKLIKYLCYQKFPKFKNKPTGIIKEFHKIPVSNGGMTAEELVNRAKTHFRYYGDFKDKKGKALRKALSVVGYKHLRLTAQAIAPLIGITPGGVQFNANAPETSNGAKETKELRALINK